MTKEALIAALKAIPHKDVEAAHGRADDLLLQFINDGEITKAYAEVPKWYA